MIACSPAGLARHVEVARLHDPDARNLPLGQAGQGGQRSCGGSERDDRAVHRVGASGREHVGEFLRAVWAAQPVRMGMQVGGPDQQRRDDPQVCLGRRADEHPHIPQAGLAVGVELRQSLLGPVGLELGVLLLVPA